MNSLKIGIVGDFFTRWMGGIAFLGPLVRGLSGCATAADASITLFLSASILPPELAGEIAPCITTTASSVRASGAVGHLLSYLSPEQPVCFYSDLRAAFRILSIHVGVAGDPLAADMDTPWCGYIPDFQHKYLPFFFSQSERMERDLRFRAIAENASGLIVNAAAVVEDVERFFPAVAKSKPIFRFPIIYPIADVLSSEKLSILLERHRITQPYLISCSQRWMHKQHELIVDGFAAHLRDNPLSPLSLVFTGSLTDYRDPLHADAVRTRMASLGITSRIREVGLIDTGDQTGLIQGAAGLVQASLFEGGVGASGSLLAVLLGTPVLASDIPPNRELTVGKRYYFDPHVHQSLSRLITDLVEGRRVCRSSPMPESVRAAIVTGGCLQLMQELRSLT